ncbi:MAG: hypothetical protein KJO05_03320 [Bacteroidia bacterium]|nr:hypothetical protein [Bacteroidia bacterium]NNF32166.1 hypothetical protein [Flavobacteriaceae bacterium]MBT8276629.1 hypothetical protein [Bacteroidia bacterium]NNJ80845.1 hypothetical protein [Flavobacteriaceae bacterium]NNK55087.1 hypothetical protein [Flavobacteriaceae bacterium]
MSNVQVHRNFKLASYFILAAVAVGIFKFITVFSDTDITASENYIRAFLNVLILALLIWLGLFIAKGRNWARITFAVLTASILVLAPFVVLKEFHTSMTIGILSSLFGIFLFIALLLLYSKGARHWYADQLDDI